MSANGTTNDSQPTPTGKTRPCHKIRLGAITCAIWKGGSETPLYNATFARVFLRGDGTWADSTSFGRDDLLVLAKVADVAHSWICEQQQRDRQGQDVNVPS